MEATSSRERLEGELSAATEIQMGFLPKPLPPDVAAGRFSLAASLVPAREVGGDLYDFFMLDDRHLCFIIGDVSDKGVPRLIVYEHDLDPYPISGGFPPLAGAPHGRGQRKPRPRQRQMHVRHTVYRRARS